MNNCNICGEHLQTVTNDDWVDKWCDTCKASFRFMKEAMKNVCHLELIINEDK